MAYVLSDQYEKKGNPLPMRGQVKARIIGILFRSVITNTDKRENNAGEKAAF